LAVVGGVWGWRRGLGLEVRTAVSVAGLFGHEGGGFRVRVGETVYDAVSWVHHRARRGHRRVGGMLPCRCWWRAGLDGVRAQGNALPALDALGGQLAPRWHARPRAGVARGIVRGCTEGLEGEVTVREAVGARLLTLGVHGGVSVISWAAWGVLGWSL
jgi:hypothetical protein